MNNTQACILSIGNELTSGQAVDTNSAWLSRALAERGIETISHETVADDQAAIALAIRTAAGKADLVLVTGGLGPTPDDLTRQAVADAIGAELVQNDDCLARIEAFFQRLGRTMSPTNRIQAMIPAGAKPLGNARGTAPGIAAELGGARIFVMPGVPHEMKAMFADGVVPRLGAAGAVILHRVVRLFGAGESDFAAKLRDLFEAAGPLTVGTTVARGIVSIRITSRAPQRRQAELQAENVIEEIRRRLGTMVVGVGDDATMASAVGALLLGARQTLATAESCTGGLVGQMITATPGASEYYLGGMVCYADKVKQALLDCPAEVLAEHGAASEQVASSMARGVRGRLGSDWGVGITGIAGPGGGTDEKPLGLVYTSLASPDGGVSASRHFFHGEREIIRLRSALAALNALRVALI